jgi:selenide, water dikinase
MIVEKISLTEFSKGAGCGCKIAPNVLQEILATHVVNLKDPKLIVGNENADDAAVYLLDNDQALISSLDFFLPIVDDPFTFGKVAAANALSDIWAMGGKPIFALAILGWPIEKIAPSIAAEVLAGARSICSEAGIVLAGGHSIDSQDPIFGLSVNGLAPVKNIRQNNMAKVGDKLILTKPIGVGILSTAQKRKVISESDTEILMSYLTSLNKIGGVLAEKPEVHAMTDVTGFGLAGHLLEICKASKVRAILSYNSIPKIKEALPYLAQRIVPDATYRNWNSYNTHIGFGTGVNVMEAFSLLPDPQTNGGLLITVKQDKAEEILALIKSNGWQDAAIIGEIENESDKTIQVNV